MALTGFFRGREKKKLLQQIERSPRPAPETFTRLAQMLREEGDIQGAVRVARKGAALHPNHPEVNRISAEMDHLQRELEKERLRQKIQSYPNPILYAKLAELYKADDEVDASVKVCQAGIAKFPNYGGTYLVLGQICVERGDYEGAKVQLEKAADLDRYNYMALKLLAEVYMHLEMPRDAAKRLEDILYFAPGDEAIMQVLQQARAAAGEPTPAKEVAAPARATSPKPAGRRAAFAAAAKELGPREHALTEATQELREIAGVSGAVLVDAFGLVIASSLDESTDEGLAGALITNVYRTTSESAEKMGVGAFEDGVIEGERGFISIVGFDDWVLAIFCDPTAKQGMIGQAIRHFGERVAELK